MNVPNSICWNITSKCNDTCEFCYRDKISTDLSFEDNIKIIDTMASEGIQKVTFAGGEPLLYPNIIDLIRYAKNKGLITSITTNAILLNKETLFELKDLVSWITLSLDGSSTDIQNSVGRNSNHYNNVIRTLDLIRDNNFNIKVKINTLVCKINIHDISNIFEIVKNYNIDRWKLFQFIPLRGDAHKNSHNFIITDENYDDMRNNIQSINTEHTINTIITFTSRLDLESGYFVLFPNGDVKISTNLKDSIKGNLIYDNVQSIWSDEDYRHDLHNIRTKDTLIPVKGS